MRKKLYFHILRFIVDHEGLAKLEGNSHPSVALIKGSLLLLFEVV